MLAGVLAALLDSLDGQLMGRLDGLLSARFPGEDTDDRRAKLRAMFRNTSPEARALLGFTPRATIEEMWI